MDVDIEVDGGKLRLSVDQLQAAAIESELGPGWFASSWELLRGLSIDEAPVDQSGAAGSAVG